MPDRVVLAEPRGFCAGVEMAIKALATMVDLYDPPVYCYHQIVHNEWIVRSFERAGVVFVDDIADVPAGAPVMLSAHGSAPDVVAAADGKASVVVDAVCPLVTKVHHEVGRLARDGYDIIYVGHEGHDEAIGTLGVAPDHLTLVEPETGLGDFTPGDPGKVALVAQTTLGMHEWEEVRAEASRRYPDLWTARSSDLCYATTNRQTAVTRLAEVCDVVLVIGSEASSNTRALVRTAARTTPAYRIDSADDIDPAWIAGAATVGLTAGASAPDHLVGAVVDRLSPRLGVDVLRAVDEEEYFPLPRRLRVLPGVGSDRGATATDALARLPS